MKGDRYIGYIGDVYDFLGVPQLDQLRVARANCDFLIVGLLADAAVVTVTGKDPIIPFEERLAIARAMRSIDLAINQLTDNMLQVWDHLRFDRLFVSRSGVVVPYHPELRDLGVDIVHLELAPSNSGVQSGARPIDVPATVASAQVSAPPEP